MTFLPMLPSVSESSERESNLMSLPLYLYLSGSAFLVSFTDPVKQLLNVKSVFKPNLDGGNKITPVGFSLITQKQ